MGNGLQRRSSLYFGEIATTIERRILNLIDPLGNAEEAPECGLGVRRMARHNERHVHQEGHRAGGL